MTRFARSYGGGEFSNPGQEDNQDRACGTVLTITVDGHQTVARATGTVYARGQVGDARQLVIDDLKKALREVVWVTFDG